MSLSTKLSTKLLHAVASTTSGQELVTALNLGAAVDAQTGVTIAAMIVAAHVSQTTDFGALKVNDQVLVIPAAAGNSHFVTVATAGTLPEAAVVGSLYVVLRPFTAPAAYTGTPSSQ